MRYSQQVINLNKDKSHLLGDSLLLNKDSSGVAGDAERGCWVGFAMQHSDGVVRSLRFQAWGCPHLIAACALVAKKFEGGSIDDLGGLDTLDLMRSLQIPTEKAGKMLILQDALVACGKSIS